MTNTINNVPFELLETLIEQHITAHGFTNHTARQAQLILCAPSPAGVDGLEVVGWYRMDDRKAITPYPSVCATWHKMGVKVGAAYSDSAQAIIDGLRGEVERLQRAEKNDAIAYKAALERQDELRSELAALKAQGVVMPEPSGWVGGGLFFHDRDKALEAAAKSPCVEVYSRSQMLARRNAATLSAGKDSAS